MNRLLVLLSFSFFESWRKEGGRREKEGGREEEEEERRRENNRVESHNIPINLFSPEESLMEKKRSCF